MKSKDVLDALLLYYVTAQSGRSMCHTGFPPVFRASEVSKDASHCAKSAEFHSDPSYRDSQIFSWQCLPNGRLGFLYPAIHLSGYWKTTLGFTPSQSPTDFLMHYRSGRRRKWQVSKGNAIWQGSEQEAAAFQTPSDILPFTRGERERLKRQEMLDTFFPLLGVWSWILDNKCDLSNRRMSSKWKFSCVK